ncbi:hypothetical protein ACMV_P5_00170 (plasmid) [Acidiphilium multivorum AIU301]|uniref:Uncharacterized protein n=1 Tax=Acidiphilium multivorum (strain DSM 11245 / JCM 8867 / NBRC 100883 / AIU 301) TaxID=926570 RepID=F0J854_ACIMA|nr:hypothetical protein [Acidiphilium multivorum]BAJ83271.1 hypothetical protein ACMV_P5_00170 [Acidiphilium multivorum AIU301]GAN72831.1 hypothetical protein Apmu_0033_04 [Acidiphilium multivorum AIU301]
MTRTPSPADLARLERLACHPSSVEVSHFNKKSDLPYGLRVEQIAAAMNEFIDFLSFINQQLATRQIERLETMLMPANFSSIVGEFMTSAIPKHCKTLVKNTYHNGHPDMLPAGKYPNDKLQHGTEGIEVKGSRYLKSWQGHNAEDAWLMVFCFSGGRPTDKIKGVLPAPFKFRLVAGAQLKKEDWKFAGRSETSRRTITASVTKTGYQKMMANWIYKAPDLA